MAIKHMNGINLSSEEMDANVSLREAYLIMYQFLNSNWENCWETPLGAIMSELSLWEVEGGAKAPMDAAVLPTFVASAKLVTSEERDGRGYQTANVQLTDGGEHR